MRNWNLNFVPLWGCFLDIAREKSSGNSHRFNVAIDACGSARIDHRPLSNDDLRNEFFMRMAGQNASQLSRKWGRWIEDFELKTDAIRPVAWIIRITQTCAGGPTLVEICGLRSWRSWPPILARGPVSRSWPAPAASAGRRSWKRSRSWQRSGRIKRQKVRNRMSVQLIRRPAAA